MLGFNKSYSRGDKPFKICGMFGYSKPFAKQLFGKRPFLKLHVLHIMYFSSRDGNYSDKRNTLEAK